MSNKKIRIKDIAELAGVSVGTVDRVLHSRGKVSDDALRKVQETLKQIDYIPNLIARTLGSNKTYHIAAIFPNPASDNYWAQSNLGIEQARSEWISFDIRVDSYFFDLNDITSFKKIAKKVYDCKPDGILLAPVFYKETLPFFESCKASKIPVVLFNTNIPEADALSFIGQDLYESGRVAAGLMHLVQPNSAHFAIVHSKEDDNNAVHLLQKEKGFRDYFQAEGMENYQTHTVKLTSLPEAKINYRLETLLEDQQLKGIFLTTSSGTAAVASFLEKHKRKDITLLGYDLLQENIEHMQSGTINFLINQNPRQQALIGIRCLANYMLLKKNPPNTNLFPLEIITRQNLNSYLEAMKINF